MTKSHSFRALVSGLQISAFTIVAVQCFIYLFKYTKIGSYRIALYLIPVAVSLRAATTLLNRFGSETLNVNTQFTHVSGHPGA